jgi:hypothetical protein
MANPFPFVAGNVLTAAQLNGIGEWTSYTPTMTAATTNPTMGNSTLVGRYARIQNLIICNFSVTIGSTFVAGVGGYSFAIPVTATAASAYTRANLGTFAFFDSSANAIYEANPWLDTTTKVRAVYAATFNGTVTAFGPTDPVIPAVSDVYSGVMIYEAA